MSYLFDAAMRIATESWLVLGQMSPYLLFGFVVAGLLSVWISPQWVERHLGHGGLKPVGKAALFGVPLPLCSCGVIPVAASMRRHGATRAATTSFLLSTPQTGVDSIAVTYALLDPIFAVVRPVVALVTGIFGGMLVYWGADKAEEKTTDQPSADHSQSHQSNEPAHSHSHAQPGRTQNPCTAPCCATEESPNWLVRALRYGLVTLPRDIGAPLLIGALVAGVIGALVPPGRLGLYLGGGVLSMLLMMAVGVPLYVCATASVPIAAGMIHLGASPGAALAFLIAGPATNAATVTTIWKLMGRRTVVLYLASIVISALLSGLLLDALYTGLNLRPPSLSGAGSGHEAGVSWWTHLWALGLVGVVCWSYLTSRRVHAPKAAPKPGMKPPGQSAGEEERPMEQLELTVEGMTCQHCAAAVQRALSECQGVQSAQVDLAAGRARVRGEGLEAEQLVAAVAGLGYEAEVVK